MKVPLVQLRLAAIGSLLINLVLATLWLRSPTGVSLRTDDPPETAPSMAPSVLTVTNSVVTSVRVVPDPPPFEWALVESDDYEVYMANLRRLEVPEWLIREMIITELRQHYRLRALQLPELENAYWLSYRESRARDRSRQAAQWALTEEERAVMKRLVGVYRHEDADSALEEGELGIIWGSLTDDQVLDVISELSFFHERAQFMERYRNHLFSPGDEQSLIAGLNAVKTELAGRVSPGQFEEFYLRLQRLIGDLKSDLSMPGLQLTGAQLRELVRIRTGLFDPVQWELTEINEPSAAEQRTLKQQVAAAIAGSLGTDVGRQYERSQNPAFRSMYELTRKHELPIERAIAVYDIRDAVINEVRNLMTSPEVDDFEKWEMRQFIQQETEIAIRDALANDAAWQDYRANDGRWMDRVGGQLPTDTAGGGR